MAEPMKFETITDAKAGGEMIHKYIRKQRVEYPDDLADLISEIAAELMCSVDACHRADFLLREQNDKKGAAVAMNEVMTAITTFKNQLGFLVSQADYCLHGVQGNRMTGEHYSHQPNNRSPLLPATTIAAGLDGIKSDFRGWRIERRTGGWVLVVETHPIKIEDPRYDVIVDFGPFNIELRLSELARGVTKPYQIVPIHPNLVPDHSGIPHPHVRSNMLCEGAGERMIRKALQVGDIQSFLIVVSQILATYNPGSPFLRLEYWSKRLPRGPNPRPHAGFGDDVSDPDACPICEGDIDESYECSLCGRHTCEECSLYCDRTSRTICSRCRDDLRSRRRACARCEEFGREQCLIEERHECADCGDSFLTGEMVRCATRSRYMCRSCFDRRARDHRSCCANWESARNCSLARHLTPAVNGFAVPGEAEQMEQPVQPLNMQNVAPIPAPRRTDGFNVEAASDDGVGGFGPPQNRR